MTSARLTLLYGQSGYQSGLAQASTTRTSATGDLLGSLGRTAMAVWPEKKPNTTPGIATAN